MDFELIIIGTDEKAYSLACSCFNRYHKKAYLIGSKKNKITHNCNILNVIYYDKLNNNSYFVNILKDFALKHNDRYLILISAEDEYTELIINNAKVLKNYYLFNYCSKEVYQQLTNPNIYFELLKQSSISFPQLYVQNLNNKINSKNITKMGFPLVIKDKKQKFIKKVNNKSDFRNLVKSQLNSQNEFLIVEKIDDSVENCCFSTLIYSSNQKKAEFSTIANLELYSDYEYQVLINGYNINDRLKLEISKVKEMLNQIGYSGIIELIWQYNKKTDKYLLINLNMDIPVSSFILVSCGYNLIERLVENLMYHKYYPFEYIKYEICLSTIPKNKLLRQIKNTEYKEEIRKLIKMNKYVNLFTQQNNARRQK